ncbi:hypothetical protein RF11_07483 [Thelohanellus kitauei]|uniref:Uncharacterized protein n=1 Tax=Thelohanellus kitauei TaxID=669202 RepID=A0A0C2NBW6_THEKT|nr:hypothetical protein RF11_07483 [Thelohanellus kitauei]
MARLKETSLLKDIIDLCKIKACVFPPESICNDKLFLDIWLQLRGVAPENTSLINTCADYILTYISKFESQVESEREYRFFTNLVDDFRPILAENIRNETPNWY